MPDEERCYECFYHASGNSPSHCLRHSPISSAENHRAQWPTVSPNGWCGDFKKKDLSK